MTAWGLLLLAVYIALAGTNRLTQRQAGAVALGLTVVVVAVALVHYDTTTPTDRYIKSVDATVYATGDPLSAANPPSTEDVAGVKAATWLTTDHRPGVAVGDTGAGG